jgi:hypothetical protein
MSSDNGPQQYPGAPQTDWKHSEEEWCKIESQLKRNCLVDGNFARVEQRAQQLGDWAFNEMSLELPS